MSIESRPERDIAQSQAHTTLSAAEAGALDNPVWSALTSHQAEFALGSARVKRFLPDVAPFAAVPEESATAFAELRAMLAATEQVALLSLSPLPAHDDLQIQPIGMVHQMVATAFTATAPQADFVRLTQADAPAMRALAGLAKPGPFVERTHLLGNFIGIRVQGQLVAMAGERMRFGNWVEVSAVCVHPEHRGAGHARALMTRVTLEIMQRHARPFLHVLTGNAGAIALYEQLGYRIRRTLHLTGLSRAVALDAAATESA
jgi:ribosomal protein S18 acetylase RimI-like enzyme